MFITGITNSTQRDSHTSICLSISLSTR